MLLAFQSVVYGASLEGDWAYTSSKPDPMFKEPPSLHLSIRVNGKKVCGTYMSAYRGGMRVAEGEFKGTQVGETATVVYDVGWDNTTGEGTARLRLKGEKLDWVVIKPGPEPDYVLPRAILKRSSKLLETPTQCN